MARKLLAGNPCFADTNRALERARPRERLPSALRWAAGTRPVNLLGRRMSITITWAEIALRLLLTILAGALIGINRGEHGRPAGLRTTLLVCLAAALAMIQTNLLLGTAGRGPNSFVTLDLMRLPLGILSGMGFIGGGVILKRDNLVMGVTTAATLWFVTILGLCFGGGQILLGLTALAIGLIVLSVLKWLEIWLPHDRQGTLIVTRGRDGPTDDDIFKMIRSGSFQILSVGISVDAVEGRREYNYELRWRANVAETGEPAFLGVLEQLPGVLRLSWNPQGLAAGLA
jgi:putative Mg2+ transporter-C (MgtC) family protein